MFPKKPKPTLAEQQVHLQKLIYGSKTKIQRGVLLWSGELKPLPSSQTYNVSLKYKLGEFPIVKVISPILKSREDSKIPHLYDDGSLCLFYPKNLEWSGYMLLANTIIPWTSEWLSHYEIWFITGTWYGGGIHNEVPKESAKVPKE